jgi:hypothetical protein
MIYVRAFLVATAGVAAITVCTAYVLLVLRAFE